MRGAEDLTFVVFGDDWGRHVSSMQHLFDQLIDRVRVIWVNGIGHREPGWSKEDLSRAAQKLYAMTRARPAPSNGRAPHTIIEPRVLPWHSRPWVARYNTWTLQRAIRSSLDPGLPPSRLVLVTGSPPSANLVGRCGEGASIYFCMDDFLHLPGTSPRMLAPLERRLLDRVDAVVVTAAALVERKRPASGRAYHLPQGVNFEHFATARPVPPELRALPRPIIGFAGGISAACDLQSIRGLARAIPHGSVVLVGPITTAIGSLDLPNIHRLGPRPYDRLPGYVQAFDVAIIPYLENDWTRAVDPLKLLEYLAAGVPVVASPLPEVLKYKEAVRVAALGEDFIAACRAALAADRQSLARRGRELARGHGWDVRAARFLEIARHLLDESRSTTRVASRPDIERVGVGHPRLPA